MLQIEYSNEKVKSQCTSIKAAIHGNMEGLFAIDVKTKADPWRIILQPLDENKEPYNPCNIDEISGIVRIVEVREVSKHYE